MRARPRSPASRENTHECARLFGRACASLVLPRASPLLALHALHQAGRATLEQLAGSPSPRRATVASEPRGRARDPQQRGAGRGALQPAQGLPARAMHGPRPPLHLAEQLLAQAGEGDLEDRAQEQKEAADVKEQATVQYQHFVDCILISEYQRSWSHSEWNRLNNEDALPGR